MRFSWRGVAFTVMAAGWCVAPVLVSAQEPASGSSSPGASKAAGATQPAPPTKPKKIWTNDDVAAASPSSSAAVEAKSVASGSAANGNSKLAKQLHDRLDQLEAQRRDTEKRLTDLKNFAAGEGNGTGGRQLHKGYSMEPVPEQIAKLETKRQQLQERIDEVYDEARKKGILPGQLR